MAIGNSYPIDKDVEDKDLVLGTDYGSNRTVNFPMEDIADYLNKKGKISIAGQTSWKFVTSNPIGGTISLINGGGNGTPFSGLTYLIMSTEDTSTQRVVEFLDYLVGGQVLLAQQKKPTQFGHYHIVSYEQSVDPLFYVLTIEFIGGNGTIKNDTYYDLVSFVPHPVEDKTFVFTQSVPSTTWLIQHNLDKFPSVSVVNINNVQMYGNVIYTDLNNLIVEFSAGFSGKAYIN
jgi:hypothetical protein